MARYELVTGTSDITVGFFLRRVSGVGTRRVRLWSAVCGSSEFTARRSQRGCNWEKSEIDGTGLCGQSREEEKLNLLEQV